MVVRLAKAQVARLVKVQVARLVKVQVARLAKVQVVRLAKTIPPDPLPPLHKVVAEARVLAMVLPLQPA